MTVIQFSILIALTIHGATLEAQQEAYLKTAHPGIDDFFGFAVAVSGDTLVIGTPYEDSAVTGVDGHASDAPAPDPSAPGNNFDSGAAYVFARGRTGAWIQQAYLKASNTKSGG